MNIVIVIDQDWKRVEVFSTEEKAAEWINEMKEEHNEIWFINGFNELDPSVPL